MDTEPLDEDLLRLGTMSAQWCNQDQILKTKTKIGPRPPEVNKDTSWIWLLSKWTPLLISTVVMFQAQNRATINTVVLEKTRCPSRSLWRRAWQYRVSQHSTRPARPRPIFWSQTGLVLRPTVPDHIIECLPVTTNCLEALSLEVHIMCRCYHHLVSTSCQLLPCKYFWFCSWSCKMKNCCRKSQIEFSRPTSVIHSYRLLFSSFTWTLKFCPSLQGVRK